MLDSLISKGFQIGGFPKALAELEDALAGTTIPIEEIIAGGGGEAKGNQRLRKTLAAKGWLKTTFVVEKMINGVRKESQSHEINHVRKFERGASIALEIEWNNKVPFYDRDLENLKRLHAKARYPLASLSRAANPFMRI